MIIMDMMTMDIAMMTTAITMMIIMMLATIP
jgi:hypothetical protein